MDLSPTLLEGKPSPRRESIYCGQPGNRWAACVGDHKLAFESWEFSGTQEQIGCRADASHQTHEPPLLFDLSADLAERWTIARKSPEEVGEIQRAIENHRKAIAAEAR